MNINKNLMSINHTAKKRSKADIQWIVVHYVGALGDAKANTDYYKSTNVGASADFFVGFAGDVWQANDYYNYYSWHCGGGYQSSWTQNGGGQFYGQCTNSNSVGIEMCVRKKSTSTKNATDTDWYFETATVNATAKLVAQLMKELDVDLNHVIRHYDVNRKICPNPFVIDHNKWLAFKDQVKRIYTGSPVISTPTSTSGATPYRVRKSWSDASSQIGAYDYLENAKKNCPEGYAVYDATGKEVYKPAARVVTIDNMVATDLKGLSEAEKIAKVAPIYQKVMKDTGMLASVGLAQFCLESGYATTDLALNANNMHGMKCSLSGNTWANSVWDGVSKYTKQTAEQTAAGQTYYITADFRKYPSIMKSVQDRAAYFIGAWLDSAKTKKRYPDVNLIKDAVTQVKLLKSGGYATDVNYVSKLTNLIDRFNLTQYDKWITPAVWGTQSSTATAPTATKSTTTASAVAPYRVGTAWVNGKCQGQVGAYDVMDNAKKVATQNKLKVFDANGTLVFDGGATTPQTPTSPNVADKYHVGTSIKDGVVQGRVGAFSVLDNAKRVADQNNLKVYDVTTGKQVYPVETTPSTTAVYYRVGTAWVNGACQNQIGAYSVKDNAIAAAKNAGVQYKVFDDAGKVVFEQKIDTSLAATVVATAQAMNTTMMADIQSGKNWVYYNSGQKATFDSARSSGVYRCNCNLGVIWVYKKAGILPNVGNFYGNKGVLKCSDAVRKQLFEKFDLLDFGGKKTTAQLVASGDLKAGDIVFYTALVHTNMCLGGTQFFDSGHAWCKTKSGDGAKFTKWVGNDPYADYKVGQVLRLKGNSVKYRVRVGIYGLYDNALKIESHIKQHANLDCFHEKVDNEYYVYCGSFSSYASATDRVSLLAQYNVPAVIEQA